MTKHTQDIITSLFVWIQNRADMTEAGKAVTNNLIEHLQQDIESNYIEK